MAGWLKGCFMEQRDLIHEVRNVLLLCQWQILRHVNC